MTKPPDDQPQDQPQQPQDPGQRRAIDKSPVVNDDAWPYQAMTTQDVDEIELEQFEIQLGKYIAEKKKPDETP